MSADHDLSTFDHEYRLHTPLVTRETGRISRMPMGGVACMREAQISFREHPCGVK